MYRGLLFRTWLRFLFSVILSFVFIGGIVTHGAIEKTKNDLENYLAWTPERESYCAERGTTIEGRYAFAADPFLKDRCTKPEKPAGILDHIRKNFVDIFALWIVLSISIFLILTSISLYISEKVVGWKRVSIVVASSLVLVSFLITLISWSSLRGDEAVVALLISCAAFPIGVLLVLGGRFTAKWVHAGFSDPTEPITLSSVRQKRDCSSVEENSAPHLTNISTDTDILVSERDKILATPLAGPWRRYWARMIDMSFFGWPIAIAMAAIAPAFEPWLQNAGSNYVFGWLCFPVVLLAEAIVFGVFGNTPGKALLGLRVTTVGGSEPSFNDYLLRLRGVYWFGLGTGFPFVSLFTMLKQFQRLKLGRETYYDSGRFNVRGYRLGFFRIVIATAVVFLWWVMVPGILTELARGGMS